MGFVWCLTFRLVEVESRVWKFLSRKQHSIDGAARSGELSVECAASDTPDRVAVTYRGQTKLVIWVKLLLSNPGHVIDANPKNDHRRLTVVNRN